MTMEARRLDLNINPSGERALLRPFYVGNQLHSNFYEPESGRTLKIIARILSLDEAEAAKELSTVLILSRKRHEQLDRLFEHRFSQIEHLMPTGRALSPDRRRLMGAYFSSEYLFEATALCNPSIVPAPGEPQGKDAIRFIISLRAIGEGHISSISFREGTLSGKGHVELTPPAKIVMEPQLLPFQNYDRILFKRKLGELGLLDNFSRGVMSSLKDPFTFHELRAAIDSTARSSASISAFVRDGILSLAQSNYQVAFNPENDMSSRVIFPLTPNQSNGMEDARFVLFDDDGKRIYYATYTAYDGRLALPQMLETEDFVHFRVSTLNGPMVYNKGMALFPRKIAGKYAMLSRQSGENIHLMYSDHPHFWYESKVILRPAETWELVQLGNCGSPIETPQGWLVLTHGVGPMRKYCIGAVLLDLDDPSRVIGRLSRPLISPPEKAEHNYVPNVVYTCGCLKFNDTLLIPYAISDSMTTFATVSLDELLRELKRRIV